MRQSWRGILRASAYLVALVALLVLAWYPSWSARRAPVEAAILETPFAPASPTEAATVAATAEPTATPLPPTETPLPPTSTSSPAPTRTLTDAPPPTLPATAVASPTRTATATPSPTGTETDTPTSTPAEAATATPTVTSEPTPTDTPTAIVLRPTPDYSLVATPEATHLWLDRPVSPDDYDWPDRYYPYGSTGGAGEYRVHHGVEFINETGTVLLAVAPARVEVAGDDLEQSYSYMLDYYGRLVVLKLEQEWEGQPVYVLYGHMDKVYVQPGQLVDPGEPIGEVGATGVALGPHLHFEVRLGANDFWSTRAPDLWLKPLPGMGTIAGRVLNAQGQPLPEVRVEISRAETPDKAWRQAWTYTTRDLQIDGRRYIDQVNPDDGWPENWTMGEVPAGTYVVGVRVNGEGYSELVEVREGEISYVELRIE